MFRAAKHTLSPQNAEALALAAFTYLAQDEDRLNAFLSEAGIDLSDLRAVSTQPYFFEAVMDHLTSSDELVLAFAEASGHAPQDCAHAAQFYKNDPYI